MEADRPFGPLRKDPGDNEPTAFPRPPANPAARPATQSR